MNEGAAEAQAAPILERGKAQAEVLRLLYQEVQKGGEEGYAVFLAEKLPELLRISVEAVKDVDIDRLVVLDTGDGGGAANAINQRVRGAIGTIEALSSSLGLDIEAALKGAVSRLKTDGAASSRIASTVSPVANPAPPQARRRANDE